MRLELRETGSILVSARKDEVLDVLRGLVEDGALVAPDRFESAGSTYVLRDAPDGTRVFHARHGSAPVPRAVRDREELRRAVATDLFELRRLFDARLRPGQ